MAETCIPPPSTRHRWVCVGDVWADNDRRERGRKVRIVNISAASGDTPHVTAEVIAASRPGQKVGKTTRIRADRLKPTSAGYLLESKTCPDHTGHVR